MKEAQVTQEQFNSYHMNMAFLVSQYCMFRDSEVYEECAVVLNWLNDFIEKMVIEYKDEYSPEDLRIGIKEAFDKFCQQHKTDDIMIKEVRKLHNV